MHEQKVYLIDEQKCLLPFLPVTCDTVQDRIQYDQHTYCSQLLTQFKDVIAYETIVRIDIGLLCKGIERASRKELKLKSQRLCFRFFLLKKFISEIPKRWRRAFVVTLLVVALHVLSTPVYDGLLTFCEVMPRYDLLAEGLQKLRFFYDRIHLAIILAHVHCIDVIRRCG